MAERETLYFDVLFVGGGPACLAGAIHLARLAGQRGMDLTVGLIEKGADIGDHGLSGAVMDLAALAELFPDYLQRGCPIQAQGCADALYFLSRTRGYRLPVVPGFLSSRGCAVISLSEFARWLASEAEALGVNIFPGFAGKDVLLGPGGKSVIGVRAGDKGLSGDGSRKPHFAPGPDLFAKITVFGEGPKGSLARDLDQKLGIYPPSMPQIFETGVKEVISLGPDSPLLTGPPLVAHFAGYPLGLGDKGGGFLYRMKENLVSLGLVVGLDFRDPGTDPHALFQAFKSHPHIARLLGGGEVMEHGAKALCAGGFHAMPRLAVNGAVIVGESASLLNPMRLKGAHAAMKSGVLAAEACIAALARGDFSQEALAGYEQSLRGSWLGQELFLARNFSQAMAKEPVARAVHLAAQALTRGRGLRDPLPLISDFKRMARAGKNAAALPVLPAQDKTGAVFLSGTRHEEDQPCHLALKDPGLCIGPCFETFRSPCTRFCPGGVYEIREEAPGERRLVLNFSNCLHCKTCEIKDPYQNISWNAPEGGGGPRYRMM